METLEKIEMPSSLTEICGYEELTLLDAMMKRNDFSGYTAYVAKDGERVVGIAVIQDGYYPAFTKIWCLEVAKDYQKRGIGRNIVESVLREHPAIKLVAKRDAFGFYQKMGFEIIPNGIKKMVEI